MALAGQIIFLPPRNINSYDIRVPLTGNEHRRQEIVIDRLQDDLRSTHEQSTKVLISMLK